jgi:hypothetical protein
VVLCDIRLILIEIVIILVLLLQLPGSFLFLAVILHHLGNEKDNWAEEEGATHEGKKVAVHSQIFRGFTEGFG